MRLALHGGLYSGKSTLARALVEQGFTYVNYTEYLKILYVQEYNRRNPNFGEELSLAEVEANKEEHRTALIAFGSEIGFDKGNYVEEALRYYTERGVIPSGPDFDPTDLMPRDIVFDNVRFDAQMEKLLGHGFRLVRITTAIPVRLTRAVNAGLTHGAFYDRLMDTSEAPLSAFDGEVALPVDGPMEDVLNTLTAQVLFMQSLEQKLSADTAPVVVKPKPKPRTPKPRLEKTAGAEG